MADDTSQLILRDFGNAKIEVTQHAYRLRSNALQIASQIREVKTSKQQEFAVNALRELRALITGIENTRKAVKRPVIDLGKQIDAAAQAFIEDVEKQNGRIQGMVNHYQRKQLEGRREEQKAVERQETSAGYLRQKALEWRKVGREDKAAECEAQAFDLEMRTELAVVSEADKPKGLVVRNRINFQVTDAILFVQGYPKFWKWNDETETLKLDRMGILDELNRDGGGLFHKTKFPEELSAGDDLRLVRPPGLRVYEEIKAHIR